MQRGQVKTPFQFSQINSYIWNRQGKRHYWGVKGKDYGLIESPQGKNRISQNSILPQLNRETITHKPYQPKKSETYEHFQYDEGFESKRNSIRQREQTRVRQYQSQKQNNRVNKVHIKTEPIQSFLPPKHASTNNKKQEKKAHLSLIPRNIHFNVHQHDSLQQEQQRINQKQMFLNKDQNINNNRSTFFQSKPRERQVRQRFKSELNSYGLNDYRDRIVRVVKKDRRNNPTFCNSLAYPLPCYRYLQ